MASITFSGKGGSSRWHAGPTMTAGGTLTGYRDGDIIKRTSSECLVFKS